MKNEIICINRNWRFFSSHILFFPIRHFFPLFSKSRQCRRGFYRCLFYDIFPVAFLWLVRLFLCLSELFFPRKWSRLTETTWQTCLVRLAEKKQRIYVHECVSIHCVHNACFVVRMLFVALLHFGMKITWNVLCIINWFGFIQNCFHHTCLRLFSY